MTQLAPFTDSPQPLPPSRSPVSRFFAFPLVWLIIGAALITIGDGFLLDITSENGTSGVIVGALVGAAVSLVLYVVTMKFIARRAMPELFHKGVVKQLLVGGGIGSAFILVVYGITVALGIYTFEWRPVDALVTISSVAAVNLGAAVVEELVFRGLVLQAMERYFGSHVSLVLSASLFGLLHLLNPGASLWSSVAISLEAGLLLGAVFLWRRSLWLVIALHFAWNTIEGLLGIPVSGHRDPGLLVSTPHGADLLSGGTFGIEASIIPVIIGVALAVTLLVVRRRNRLREASSTAELAATR